MKQITVDDETYELAERLALRKGVTVGEAVTEVVRDRIEAPLDPMAILGCLADEADFLDQLVEEALRDRLTAPLRMPDG